MRVGTETMNKGRYTADAMRLKHSLSASGEGLSANVMTPVSEGNSDVTGSVFLALAFFSSLPHFLRLPFSHPLASLLFVFSLLCHFGPSPQR